MKVKFGDVVNDVKKNVNRSNNPYEFYVAGDHMDSEDFSIRRRGRFATDDVGPAFIRIFHPGQVLYGSRRTYLKKVCVADFDGVCANTTFVFETKNENVLTQRFLPFLMLSDGFTDWSIKHSKGSTNPYVLFSDLADYEFDLPPIERQRELADLLWAANDLKEAYKKLIAASDEMLQAKFKEMFECNNENTMVKLGDVCKTISGGTPNSKIREYYEGGNIPWMSSGEVAKGIIHEVDGVITELGLKNSSAKIVPINSVVVAMYGATAGKVGILKLETTTNQAVCSILPNEKFIPEFLYFTLLNLSTYMTDNARGAAQPNISQKFIRELQIPLPPLSLQEEFVEIVNQQEKVKQNLRESIAQVENIIKGLINS